MAINNTQIKLIVMNPYFLLGLLVRLALIFFMLQSPPVTEWYAPFLQNSIKHSNCEKMEVNLSKEDFYLKLIMKDNGNGFDTNKINSGIGLLNMKKRTELIRGIFLLESDKNGTNLSIKIPI
jgi:glucose-6-phosphate-specific signal transduction histidine kinase